MAFRNYPTGSEDQFLNSMSGILPITQSLKSKNCNRLTQRLKTRVFKREWMHIAWYIMSHLLKKSIFTRVIILYSLTGKCRVHTCVENIK